MAEEDILIEWEAPQKARQESRKYLVNLFKKIIPRVTLLAWIIIFITYIAVKDTITPQNSSWERVFFIIALGIPLYLILITLLAYFSSYSGHRYQIKEKGIRYIGNKHRFYRWETIKGYCLENDKDTGEPESILMLLKKQRERKIPLPDGPAAKEIINLITEQVPFPEYNDGKSDRPVISRQFSCLLYLITIIFSLVWAILFSSYKNKDVMQVTLLSILILGPGSMGFFLKNGWKFMKNPYLRAHALGFNLLGMILYLLFWCIIALHYFSKIIKNR
ncbi:MAG: hypothetical protein JW860_09130 [Sedimentisphaerales bacterium]|nr:hypothetical protein [Sedimentisphaerales bacterium]